MCTDTGINTTARKDVIAQGGMDGKEYLTKQLLTKNQCLHQLTPNLTLKLKVKVNMLYIILTKKIRRIILMKNLLPLPPKMVQNDPFWGPLFPHFGDKQNSIKKGTWLEYRLSSIKIL